MRLSSFAVVPVALFAVGCSPSTPPTDAPEVTVEPPPGAESAAPTATVTATAAPKPEETAAPPVATGEPGQKPPPGGFPFGRPDAGGQVVAGSDACTSDADCVAATCCHPSTCVARGKAPKCDAVMC